MKGRPMSKLARTGLCVVAAVIFVTVLAPMCLAKNDGEFQYWSTLDFKLNLNKDWETTYQEEFRFGDDVGEMVYHHSDLGFVYKSLADWIDIGINYREIQIRNSAGKWKRESRPHVNLTFKGKLFDLDVSDRSRLEFRDREEKTNLWRYRNKFTVKLPWELTELKLKPYIANEVFISLTDENFDQNRVSGGFSLNFSENVKGGIYYLLKSDRSGNDWTHINVLGTQLKFYF